MRCRTEVKGNYVLLIISGLKNIFGQKKNFDLKKTGSKKDLCQK